MREPALPKNRPETSGEDRRASKRHQPIGFRKSSINRRSRFSSTLPRGLDRAWFDAKQPNRFHVAFRSRARHQADSCEKSSRNSNAISRHRQRCWACSSPRAIEHFSHFRADWLSMLCCIHIILLHVSAKRTTNASSRLDTEFVPEDER